MKEPRYLGKVIPLHKGRRQVGKEFIAYTHAASEAQASRFLQKRHPYPKYLVEDVRVDIRKSNSNRLPLFIFAIVAFATMPVWRK